MRIAVIGSGISGLVAAFVLQRGHDVTVFERSDRVGGHTHTIDVGQDGSVYPVDTGFVVYNETTYPNFVRLLDRLGVASQPTSMSFSVRCEASGLEYCGSSLNALFAQRMNLLRPGFYRLLTDIARFNARAGRAAENGTSAATLEQFLSQAGGSESLRHRYVVPLVAAIWSMDPERVADFPAEFFLRFASRHRLLQVRDQLRWRVIRGGSREYLAKLTASLRNPVRTGTEVVSVCRDEAGVTVGVRGASPLRFDRVVIAAHSDQALRLLADPSDDELEILGAIPYQENSAVLHTDASLLPSRRRAWANWNYRVDPRKGGRPITTYNMSGLQQLETVRPILVTLNDDEAVAPSQAIRRLRYSHPVFAPAAVAAQRRRGRIDGVRRTHYCGAYWGYGFHEDGVASALDVCRAFEQEL